MRDIYDHDESLREDGRIEAIQRRWQIDGRCPTCGIAKEHGKFECDCEEETQQEE